MAMAIPVVPQLPAGHIATVDEMNQLAYACTFLLTKPVARVRDTAGGATVGTTAAAVAFNTKDTDTDGMWSSGANTRLTIQTPGWYKFRYGISTAGGHAVNTKLRSTTGPNNPAGSGIGSGDHWGGYCPSLAAFDGAAGCSGIWPFYLYSGDFLQVFVLADTTGNSLVVAQAGSFFDLEFVSV
jgi:hypothetical protein